VLLCDAHARWPHAYDGCCYVRGAADLERPFGGLVRVDTSIFDRIRMSISSVLAEVSLDEQVTIWVGCIPLDLVLRDTPEEGAESTSSASSLSSRPRS
jgi:hypothetical protein